MFKSKWQKKYEKVMDRMQFWINFHAEAQDALESNPNSKLYVVHTSQKIALQDMLRDMKKIAKES